MKFEIQQEDLQKVLDVVHSVVPAKTTLPILTCVLMEAAKGKLSLTATNLDISITTNTDKVEIKDEGKIAIPAAKFVSFVRSLRPGSVTLAQTGEQVQIDAGKSRFTENTMNVQEYPSLQPFKEKNGVDLEGGLLIDLINETSYSVSRDETRPALMGILWEVRPDSLTLVATDAHRLASTKRKFELDIPADRDMIVDTAGLRHLPRAVAAMGEDEEASGMVTMYMGENQLSFKAGSTVLYTRLLEGPFPDYHAVIPKDNDKQVVVDRQEFAQAIRRVSITADRITNQIRLGIESGLMELSARGTEGTQASDEIAVAYEGDAMEIGFNFNYLQDILKNIRSDSVTLLLRDAQNAALLKPVTEEGVETGLLCLLMPLRLSGD